MAPPEENSSRGCQHVTSGDASANQETLRTADDDGQQDPSTMSNSGEPDPWALSAEGYTPLTELGSDGAIYMAYPPDDDHEQEISGTTGDGTFLADDSVIDIAGDGVNHFHNGEEAQTEQTGRETTSVSLTQSNVSALANQALKALNDEYQKTLQRDRICQADDQAGVATSEAVNLVDDVRIHLDPNEFGRTYSKPPLDVPPAELNLPTKIQPRIDTEAVRRAIDSIRQKAPDLTANLQSWQDERSMEMLRAIPPRVHPIIPHAPLSAFRKRTPKAIRATSNLSRSCTLAEAIHRLSCMPTSRDRLVVHVIGADRVECESQDKLHATFSSFVRWIGAIDSAPRCIDMHLIGPNVPASAETWSPVSLMPKTKLRITSPLVEATAQCHMCVYDEWLERRLGSDEFIAPDVAIAFNAGIWGYNEWRITLSRLCDMNLQIPFISTGYTIQEAEEDADVFVSVLQSRVENSESSIHGDKRLWGVESNPFGSRETRPTANAVSGRVYRENSAWQAWRL